MSVNKAPIIEAKKKTTTTPVATTTRTTIQTRGAAVPARTGGLGDYWINSVKGDVEGLNKSLTDIGVVSRTGVGSFTDRGVGTDVLEVKNLTPKEIEKAKQTGTIERPSQVSKSAKLEYLNGIKEMYDLADRYGYKTSDQFRTAYPELIEGISNPKIKALFKDAIFQQATQTEGANLKNVAAEKFGRLIRERDQSQQGAQSTTQAMPQSTPAQTPPPVQLRVTKTI